MSAYPIRRRLIPYKILAHLLYGQHTWLSRLPGGKVKVETGPLGRSLRVTSNRLGEHFDWLLLNGLIEEVETPQRGQRIVTLKTPLGMDEAVEDVAHG